MNDEGGRGCKGSKYHIDQKTIKQEENEMMQKNEKKDKKAKDKTVLDGSSYGSSLIIMETFI